MGEAVSCFAKLSGIKGAVQSCLSETWGNHGQTYQNFQRDAVERYFSGALKLLAVLRAELPSLYEDFADFPIQPNIKMGPAPDGAEPEMRYSRAQMQRLERDIEQIFEIRANSELASPSQMIQSKRRVFISHGRANDWREVQAYIERDIGIQTLELAQEPNQGKTILAKLSEAAEQCDAAVIVMTGDDLDAEGKARARENVVHEIGFFQGKYGLDRVCLLHEDGVSIPSNIHGLVYTPFTNGAVSATFGLLVRELKAMYQR